MYCGYIVELHNLRKHSNADRLQCVEVFGNNIIVDLSYQEGQKVVFFPVDGRLSDEYAEANNLIRKKDENGNNIGGYLEPGKNNIKALKLRGEKSEGLVLPIETLSKYISINELNVGDKITTLNGHLICEKYIPKKRTSQSMNSRTSKNKKEDYGSHFPIFKEHEDTEQLMFNKAAFKEGDKCTITLKIHGSSGRSSHSIEETDIKQNFLQKLLKKPVQKHREWTYVSGTRRVVLEDYDGGYYGSNEFRHPWHDFFIGKLEKGETVYYEIAGYVNETIPIMGTCSNSKLKDKELKKLYGNKMEFTYGCKPGENRIFVYRMTMTNEDGYVVEYPDWLMRLRCEMMGAECVPLFETFTFTTWEDLMERVEKYYDGPDPIGKTHIREGVVVRIENRKKFTAFKHKNFTFKVVEGIVKDEAEAPDMEEAQELISGAGDP